MNSLIVVLIILFYFLLLIYRLILQEKFCSNSSKQCNSNIATAKGYFNARMYSIVNVIKKCKLNFLFSIFCVGLLLLFNISARQSFEYNFKNFTVKDKEQSINFKLLNGSNRIHEFVTLTQTFDQTISNEYEVKDIISILGEPNSKDEYNNTLTYYLFLGNNICKGILTFNNNKLVCSRIEGNR